MLAKRRYMARRSSSIAEPLTDHTISMAGDAKGESQRSGDDERGGLAVLTSFRNSSASCSRYVCQLCIYDDRVTTCMFIGLDSINLVFAAVSLTDFSLFCTSDTLNGVGCSIMKQLETVSPFC